MRSGAVEEQAGCASETTQQLVIKDELVWRILSEGAPCARLTNRSSQYNLTPKMFKLTCFAPRRIGGTAQRLNSSESRRNTFSPSRRAFGTMLVSMYSTARFAAASTSLGGLLEGFRYGSFLSHTGSVKTPRQTSAVLKARRCRVQASLCQLRAKSVSPSSSREASSASKTVGKGLRTGSASLT